MAPNSKTEYSRNVCSHFCVIYLTCPVLEALFICIYLLATYSCSVDKLICLPVCNWLEKSRVGSPPPKPCPSAHHIPWPRVLNFSSFIADVATLRFPRTYIILNLRTFTSCQGTCTHPQVITFSSIFFFLSLFWNLLDYFSWVEKSLQIFFSNGIWGWWREVVNTV